MFTINCKGKLLVLETPVVMGIINITPDSFYEGYQGKTTAAITAIAARMISEGASILDIGGQSTRPGSNAITELEEMNRVLPVIRAINEAFPGMIISIDTYYAAVAKAAFDAGASIVNDISGGNMDKDMIPAVAALQAPYICMHMKGTPATMQKDIAYDDVVKEVLDFFIAKTYECKEAGIKDVIIDPGFGFGKTINHNFQLLENLELFKMPDRPILAGLSRKSTIYKTLGTDAAGALNGTTALNMIALQNGADILRVHDVKEAVECVKLYTAMKKANQTASTH